MKLRRLIILGLLAGLAPALASAAGGSSLTPAAGISGSVQVNTNGRAGFDPNFRYWDGVLYVPSISATTVTFRLDGSSQTTAGGGGGGGGDITAVVAGTGLAGGGTSGALTLYIDDQGVGTDQIADGSINLSKLLISGGYQDGDALVVDLASGGLRKLTPLATYYGHLAPSWNGHLGSGATYYATDVTSWKFGKVGWAGNSGGTTNYIVLEAMVPRNYSSTETWRADDLNVLTEDTDTGNVRFTLSIATVAYNVGTASAPSFGNSVTVDLVGPSSGAIGRALNKNTFDLPGWNTVATPGATIFIKIAREGANAADTSVGIVWYSRLLLRYGKSST